MQQLNPFAPLQQRAPLSDITNQQPASNPFAFPTSTAPKFLIPGAQVSSGAPLFNTAVPTTKFFALPAELTTPPADADDDDDGSYIEGEDDSPRGVFGDEDDGDQEVIMQGAAAQEDGMADEGDDGQSSSSEDEESALKECCEPEVNAVQELQQELQEHFNRDDYERFKERLALEEAQQQQYLEQQQLYWQ